jgi:hypothetical protein
MTLRTGLLTENMTIKLGVPRLDLAVHAALLLRLQPNARIDYQMARAAVGRCPSPGTLRYRSQTMEGAVARSLHALFRACRLEI